jgi:hypothetical protein
VNHGERPHEPAGTHYQVHFAGERVYVFMARYYFLRLVMGVVF